MTAAVLTPDADYLVPLRDVERELARQMKALQGPGDGAGAAGAHVQPGDLLQQPGAGRRRINAQVPEVDGGPPGPGAAAGRRTGAATSAT